VLVADLQALVAVPSVTGDERRVIEVAAAQALALSSHARMLDSFSEWTRVSTSIPAA
jgi:hypothetical protein